jgi:hypothetical protein
MEIIELKFIYIFINYTYPGKDEKNATWGHWQESVSVVEL